MSEKNYNYTFKFIRTFSPDRHSRTIFAPEKSYPEKTNGVHT
jgi:hypothetical protein